MRSHLRRDVERRLPEGIRRSVPEQHYGPPRGRLDAGRTENGDRRRFPVIDDALAENEATGAASSSVA